MYGFLNWNEIEQIKKRSLFISTGWLRQFNGFYFSLGAISSHSWPSVTRGWKWHLVRDKNHFIFLTPVTVNKSLDSRRKSNIWHCIKKRKTALKFFTFKLRLGPLLVHLSTRLICQIIPIYMLFEIFAKKFNFVIAIAKKIEENVKCLRLVKITFL